MADVRCCKLSSGEELIFEFVSQSEDLIVGKYPTAITMIHGDGQRIGIGMVPICTQANDNSIRIRKDKIVWTYVPNTRFVEEYQRIVNPTPIVMPPNAGGLVGPDGKFISSGVPFQPKECGAMIVDNPNLPVDLSDPFDEESEEDSEAIIDDDWKTE